MQLRDGATETDTLDTRQQVHQVALAVWGLVADGYGPGGGTILVDDELLESPASALRSLPTDPLVAPYQRLAADIQTHCGDGATTAVMLAARLVIEAGKSMERGLSPATIAAGFHLARRQAVAHVQASRKEAAPEVALAALVPEDWARAIVAGLPNIVEGGVLSLDDIHLHEDAIDTPAWADGLVLEATSDRRRSRHNAAVGLIRGGLPKSQHSMELRLRQATAEDRRIDDAIAAIEGLGIGFLACEGALDDELAGRLTSRGILVAKNTGKASMRRLAAATGADLVVHPGMLTGDGLGSADIEPRPVRRGGYLLTGPGPGATLLYPGGLATLATARKDAIERALRLAGVVLEDPRALAGGGRWQRGVAQALRDAAPHAPGKEPLAIETAARAFVALADQVVRNTGQDPLDVPFLKTEAVDASAVIKAAITGAFEVAGSILRLDGVYRKRSSDPASLRGGLGPAGSPKGMPGDVPPDM